MSEIWIVATLFIWFIFLLNMGLCGNKILSRVWRSSEQKKNSFWMMLTKNLINSLLIHLYFSAFTKIRFRELEIEQSREINFSLNECICIKLVFPMTIYREIWNISKKSYTLVAVRIVLFLFLFSFSFSIEKLNEK